MDCNSIYSMLVIDPTMGIFIHELHFKLTISFISIFIFTIEFLYNLMSQ